MITATATQWRLLKCVAFVAMVLDHGSKAGIWQLPGVLAMVGKLAFPLFVIAFAVSISRTGQCRVKRLLVLAVIAQPGFVWLFGAAWWDLNVLFVFVAGWWIYQLGQRGRLQDWMAVAALLIVAHLLFKGHSGGLFWPLSVAFAVWSAAATGRWRVLAALGAVLSWAALRDLSVVVVLVALALLLVTARTIPATWKIPRVEFGMAYAIHLFLLALIRF